MPSNYKIFCSLGRFGFHKSCVKALQLLYHQLTMYNHQLFSCRDTSKLQQLVLSLGMLQSPLLSWTFNWTSARLLANLLLLYQISGSHPKRIRTGSKISVSALTKLVLTVQAE